MIGFKEILVILLIVLLVFGSKKIANIGSDLGSAIKGFKKSMKDGEAEVDAEKTDKTETGRGIEGKKDEKKKETAVNVRHRFYRTGHDWPCGAAGARANQDDGTGALCRSL